MPFLDSTGAIRVVSTGGAAKALASRLTVRMCHRCGLVFKLTRWFLELAKFKFECNWLHALSLVMETNKVAQSIGWLTPRVNGTIEILWTNLLPQSSIRIIFKTKIRVETDCSTHQPTKVGYLSHWGRYQKLISCAHHNFLYKLVEIGWFGDLGWGMPKHVNNISVLEKESNNLKFPQRQIAIVFNLICLETSSRMQLTNLTLFNKVYMFIAL